LSTRRISSRKVVLTATFLALAAGGTAACDNSSGEGREYAEEPAYTYDSGGGGTVVEAPVTHTPATKASVTKAPVTKAPVTKAPVTQDPVTEESSDEVFYCADEEGEIVDEEYCDDDTDVYFIWHSTSYSRGLGPGTYLDDGDYFSPGDTESRRAFKLPAAGRIPNGTVKTNVVGRGSNGSTTGGTSSGG
jgi:hypothetical protein